jgi:ubiquinone/menaquinone biosynthesis C-methylase UbiE
VSTYVLMRILESAPRRYDFGVRLLSLGRLDGAYDHLVSHIAPGQKVLDVGCGTGALTLRIARLGARVKAIDSNAQMLEIATSRVREAGLRDSVDIEEMGVAELDRECADSYDAITAGLCFSELSEDELRYTLIQAKRILKPGGLLLIADEVRPQNPLKRCIYLLIRIPLVAFTYALTQQTTRPLSRLVEQLEEVGLSLVSVHTSALENFTEFSAQKPGDSP